MEDLIGLLNRELDGRYRVSAEIGRGGMAVVYLGQDLRHDRAVAIKVLLPELGAVAGPGRFLQEIAVEAHLFHPNIVPLLDSGSVDGLPFYVMPFVSGESLAERLARETQLPVEEAVRLGVEVADALAHAHGEGLVHRDVKPANILLESGHALVADFGVALATRDIPASRLTGSGISLGSPLYMSPEQAGGSEELDGRSDVYSLGCVLFEALTGDPPFAARLPQAILARKLTEDPPSCRVVRGAVPEALDRAISRALARDPGDRFPDAGSFRDALIAVREGRAQVEPVAGGPRVHRRGRVETGVQWAAWAGAGVVLMAAVGFLTNRVHDLRLRIPPEYAPTRSDFLALGFATLLPLLVWGLCAVVIYVMARYLVRIAGWAIHRSSRLGETADATGEAVRGRWAGAWRRLRPQTVADLYFVVAVVVGIAALLPHRGILAGMAGADTSALSDPVLRRSFSIVLAVVILGLLVSWRAVFRYVARGEVHPGRVAVSRWGSLAWILALLVVTTMPWRLLWDAQGERVLLDGRRAYLLLETPSELLIYDHGAGEVVTRPNPSPDLRLLGSPGYIFEAPEDFARRQTFR